MSRFHNPARLMVVAGDCDPRASLEARLRGRRWLAPHLRGQQDRYKLESSIRRPGRTSVQRGAGYRTEWSKCSLTRSRGEKPVNAPEIPMRDNDDLIGVSQVRSMTGFSRDRIFQLIRIGLFPPCKVPSTARWSKVEVSQWCSRLRARPN